MLLFQFPPLSSREDAEHWGRYPRVLVVYCSQVPPTAPARRRPAATAASGNQDPGFTCFLCCWIAISEEEASVRLLTLKNLNKGDQQFRARKDELQSRPIPTAVGGPPARAPRHGAPPSPYPCGPRPLPYGMPPVGLCSAASNPSPAVANAMTCRSAISFPHGDTFHLPQGTCYHNSYGEWLLLSREDGTCFLMNAFAEDTMEIPSLSSYSPCNEPVETVNDRIVPDDELHDKWMNVMSAEDITVVSLIVCSPCLIAAIVADDDSGYDPGTIALCRPGAAEWSVSAHEPCRCLSDMAFFQGKLYAIDTNTEDLLAIDIVDEHDNNKPRVSRIVRIIGCYADASST
ncbi:hypothetical protein EJB05_29913, partial [Eragrostis curvula]